MTKDLFEKFFIVGNVVKLDHKVSCSVGNMYGKVQLYPTEKNIFFNKEYQYVGVYDNEHQGLIDVYTSFTDFFKYTLIKPMEFYEYIFKIYEKSHH